MTVGELGRRMSAKEFVAWMAYDRVEPFGEARADLRAGIIASVLANVNRSADTPAFTPADFMPLVKRPPPPESESISERIKRAFAEFSPPSPSSEPPQES